VEEWRGRVDGGVERRGEELMEEWRGGVGGGVERRS